MHVIIIPHYINFNLSIKNKQNIFPRMLLDALKKAGMTYEICKYTLKDITDAVKRGGQFILNFEEASPGNSVKFMGYIDGAVDGMFKYMMELEKTVPMYPPMRLLWLIKSKKYLDVLPNKTKLYMPHTQTFMYYKTTAKSLLIKSVTRIASHGSFTNIVIKFGGSGDTDHVFHHTINTILDDVWVMNEILEEMHTYREIYGTSFLVIVQFYNPVISNRLNEYRTLFTNGVMSPIAAFGFSLSPQNTRIYIPSVELDLENIEHAEIITLAKYGHQTICKYIGFVPSVLRVDVSWVVNEDGTRRYYINEFEGLSGTYYFRIPYTSKDVPYRLTDAYECTPSVCSEYPEDVQRRLASSLVAYIKRSVSVSARGTGSNTSVTGKKK